MKQSDRRRLLIAELGQLAQDHELQFAHAAEYVQGGGATPEVRAALDAAVHGGIAIGLKLAIELLAAE